MTTKKITKKPKKGDKKKFYGIWFTHNGICWTNDYIPFISFK